MPGRNGMFLAHCGETLRFTGGGGWVPGRFPDPGIFPNNLREIRQACPLVTRYGCCSGSSDISGCSDLVRAHRHSGLLPTWRFAGKRSVEHERAVQSDRLSVATVQTRMPSTTLSCAGVDSTSICDRWWKLT